MADISSSIFNKKATEKLRSPDDLEKYVRVTNPSVWLIVGSCLCLLVGLLIWGIFGAISTSVSTTGTVVNNVPICFLSGQDASHVNVGDMATVDGKNVVVSNVTTVPYSRDEAHELVENDYLVSTLMQEDWGYLVEFERRNETDTFANYIPVSVVITTERFAPISLIFGSQ